MNRNIKQYFKKAVIVLPTYNERGNIERLLNSIQNQQHCIDYARLHTVVVDDSSPDGTGEFIKKYAKKHSNVTLLNGKSKQGLGVAYIRGFRYALNKLKADVVFQMDADFSHNPNDIPRLLHEAFNGSDFVIGSRYVKGGSIPDNWSLVRKLNSKFGNIFARYIVGLKNVHDCTGGYRAIKAEILRKIDFDQLHVKGYAFIVSLLYQAKKNGAVITELPIHFSDRSYGESKLKIIDIKEFITSALLIRLPFLKLLPKILIMLFFGLLLGEVGFIAYIFYSKVPITSYTILTLGITITSSFMTFQSIFSIYWMLYAWENAERIEKDKPPKKYSIPKRSFTAIIPARHEEKVIGDTIKAVASINYPESLKEIIVVCRHDDTETIARVNEIIRLNGNTHIHLVVFNDSLINKPHSLNIGLKHATKDTVVVFDAEDHPHKNIYNIINTSIEHSKADVVQSGVQLMNYRSHWFSTLNVLEYFFWFKSTLHYFARVGVIPLGGNTVFFKRALLQSIGGWDENCLTEDADIGIRLSATRAKIKVIYSEQHVTQEETPTDVKNFIRQRTRWNQGFIQVLLKKDWLKLPRLSQKLLAMYVLTLPEFQAVTFILIPISVALAITLKLPILIALFTSFPLLLLVLQLVIYNIGLYEFTKEYRQKYHFLMPIKIILTFYPFQFLLGLSAFRAVIRTLTGNILWEKTKHINAHRNILQFKPAYSASP